MSYLKGKSDLVNYIIDEQEWSCVCFVEKKCYLWNILVMVEDFTKIHGSSLKRNSRHVPIVYKNW